MKLVPEGHLDLDRLVRLYSECLITAEEYYRAMEEYAKTLIAEEV